MSIGPIQQLITYLHACFPEEKKIDSIQLPAYPTIHSVACNTTSTKEEQVSDHSRTSPSAIFINNSSNTQKERKADSNDHSLAAAMGAISAIVAALGLGKILSNYQKAKHTYSETRKMEQLFAQNMSKKQSPDTSVTFNQANEAIITDKTFVTPDTQNKIKEFFAIKKSLDGVEITKMNWYFISLAGLLIGGVITFVGALLPLQALITLGAVTILLGAMVGCFNFSFHWDDEIQKEQRNKLPTLKDQILDIIDPPPSYQEIPSAPTIYPDLHIPQ